MLPTPPLAPRTSNFSPFLRFALYFKAIIAVAPTPGNAAVV